MNQFLNDFILGYKSYIQAWKFIREHKLWFYFVIPIVVFGSLIYFGFWMRGLAGEASVMSEAKDISFFVSIWYKFKFLIYWIIAVMALNLTRYIMMTLLSPVLSVVSERVEKILTGNNYSFNLPQMFRDIKRGIKISIRNVFREILLVSAIYIVAAFVGWLIDINLSWLSLTLSLLIAFFYYGFGFMDYINERRRLTIRQSVLFVRKHWGLAISLGSVFVLIFQILFPLFEGNKYLFLPGAVIVSVIPIFSIIASTLALHALVDLSTNEYAVKTIGGENFSPSEKPDGGNV
jgi:CysZ protein